MFEHIYFIKQVYSPPVSSTNYRNIFPFELNDGDASDFYDNIEDSYYRFLNNGSFYLNGKVKMVPYYPVSKEAEDKLLYIESFSIFSVLAHYFTERRNLDSYLLIYTVKGKGKLIYDGKTYELEKGRGFFIDCKMPHRYETLGNEWVHWDLHFNGKMAELLYREFSASNNVVFEPSSETEFMRSMEDLISTYETFDRFRDLLISHKLENIIMFLIINTDHFGKSSADLPEDMKYLICYMNNNYMHLLNLDQLAEFVGISKFQLIRTFRKYMNVTPQEYLIRLRIRKAKELLESTDIHVNEIGCIVGIENSNYFYHLFKKRFGKTPKEYRREHS